MNPITLVTELEEIIESLDLTLLTRAEITDILEQLKDCCGREESRQGFDE
ncbi:hypothetical protein ACE1B4_10980 [Aeromonas veronii]|nr:hypothetical protein [Aeromonas veronii]HDO1311206.1 hypothetical protein [Aeromonas veronii]